MIDKSGKKNPSVRDFVEASGRGTLNEGPTFVGTATQVADEMQQWFETACDGFVMSATQVPGSYEDFARMVVPELQRRNLFRREYPGTTLRETLGVTKPAVHSWRKPSAKGVA